MGHRRVNKDYYTHAGPDPRYQDVVPNLEKREHTALQQEIKQEAQEQHCPNCGMPREKWQGNNGAGVTFNNRTYCCQGCADGTGCTCD